MGWKQTKGFDTGKAGTQKYLCLKNVRLGYGIASKWEYARQDWDNNVAKHADQNFPAGVAVPVYFSWVGTLDGIRRDWGHVAVRLPDGRIWTDGRYYASVSTLAANYLSGGSYLGWGESVNGVRVVEQVADSPQVSDPITDKHKYLIRVISSEVKGWDRGKVHNGDYDAKEMAFWRGKSIADFSQSAWDEGAGYRKDKDKWKAAYDREPELKKQLAAKPKEIVKEVEKKIVVDPSYFAAGDLLRALLQKAVAWFNKKG